MRYGYVYMTCSYKNGTIYVGMTSDLGARVTEHKNHANPDSFTAKNKATRLVWYERHDLIVDAIAREKAIKNWDRQWKVELIEKHNPEWREIILEFDD